MIWVFSELWPCHRGRRHQGDSGEQYGQDKAVLPDGRVAWRYRGRAQLRDECRCGPGKPAPDGDASQGKPRATQEIPWLVPGGSGVAELTM